MPSVLSILLATYFDASTGKQIEALSQGLRLYAATLLVYIIDHFAEFYPTLKSRIVATLIQALVLDVDDGTSKTVPEASGSLDAKLGALMGLRKLGPSSFKTLLGPVSVQPGVSANQQSQLVPLKVMGEWLAELGSGDEQVRSSRDRFIQEIKGGLDGLEKNTAEPSSEALEKLRNTYGAFWIDTLHEDTTKLSVLAHYQTLIAS